jgi:SAM-dependent methyltransferase
MRNGFAQTRSLDVHLEPIWCPVCGGSGMTLLHEEPPFHMVRCGGCRHVYVNPKPVDRALRDFYQHYLPQEESSIEAWRTMMAPVTRRAAREILRLRSVGRLLDVGAGYGFFVSEMKARGWDAAGVEISEKAIGYARHRLGLIVYPGPLEPLCFEEGSFDVVTGFYIVEHLSDPLSFLEECHRILTPGGFLFLRYPHTTPIKDLLRLFGVTNRLYDMPAHLSDFSPESVARCLVRVGFEEVRHLLGGYTRPGRFGARAATLLFGNLAEALFYFSGKRFLLPGVSKTAIAFKRRSGPSHAV